MKRVLVSILSKHTIPNFLFIKEMKGEYDELLFITTEKSESKEVGMYIEVALGWDKEPIKRILVDSNDYNLVISQLQEKNLPTDVHYMVNITGGTKATSMAVAHYFSSFMHSTLYYIPVGNEYINISNNTKHIIDYRLTLEEYFWLYGIDIEIEQSLTGTKGEAQSIYNEMLQVDFSRKAKRISSPHRYESKEMKDYYAGKWFEEYTYDLIKRKYSLQDKFIARNIKLFRKGDTNDNEIDVAFVLDNKLYVIECKVRWHVSPHYNNYYKDQFEDALYKLAAISKDFGLVVRPYLFAIYPPSEIGEGTWNGINRRGEILEIDDIVTNEKVKDFTIKK